MVDRLESGIEKILGGAAVEDESTAVVDYTLADQNDDLAALLHYKKKVTTIQLEMLVKYMEHNRNMCIGKLTPEFTLFDRKKRWKDLAEQLNTVGNGPIKDVSQWRKCWADQKSAIQKKAKRIQQQLAVKQETGMGDELLTKIEKRVLKLVGIANGVEEMAESDDELSCEAEIDQNYHIESPAKPQEHIPLGEEQSPGTEYLSDLQKRIIKLIGMGNDEAEVEVNGTPTRRNYNDLIRKMKTPIEETPNLESIKLRIREDSKTGDELSTECDSGDSEIPSQGSEQSLLIASVESVVEKISFPIVHHLTYPQEESVAAEIPPMKVKEEAPLSPEMPPGAMENDVGIHTANEPAPINNSLDVPAVPPSKKRCRDRNSSLFADMQKQILNEMQQQTKFLEMTAQSSQMMANALTRLASSIEKISESMASK